MSDAAYVNERAMSQKPTDEETAAAVWALYGFPARRIAIDEFNLIHALDTPQSVRKLQADIIMKRWPAFWLWFVANRAARS